MFSEKLNLIYFAFPKCASHWVQYELEIRGNNLFKEKWNDCDINYCHVNPILYIEKNNIDVNETFMFSIIRNPYERLVSSWIFGKNNNYSYKTFEEFIYNIENNKNNLLNLPFCWMFLPLDIYFGKYLDNIKFFKLEELDTFIHFMKEKYNIEIRNYKVNESNHLHYSKYYTKNLINIVENIYNYEIKTFNYKFQY